MNYHVINLQLRRIRYEVRNIIADYPPVYIPLARLKSGTSAAQVVNDDTQILIEGWPRSGNTFAEQAFRMSQPMPVRLAHHFHAPAQVIAAVRRGLPTLVLVRNPVDSVCSFVIRETAVTLTQALRSWLRFHEGIMDFRHDYIIGTFDQVTTDFGKVIQRVNTHFGTGFGIFDHTPENAQRCFGIIEANNKARFGNGTIVETGIARPSPVREAQKNYLQNELKAKSLQPLLNRARQVHENFVAWAVDG